MVVFPLPGAPRNAAWCVNSAGSKSHQPCRPVVGRAQDDRSGCRRSARRSRTRVLAGPSRRRCGWLRRRGRGRPGFRAIEIEDLAQRLQQAERFALLEPGIEGRVCLGAARGTTAGPSSPASPNRRPRPGGRRRVMSVPICFATAVLGLLGKSVERTRTGVCSRRPLASTSVDLLAQPTAPAPALQTPTSSPVDRVVGGMTFDGIIRRRPRPRTSGRSRPRPSTPGSPRPAGAASSSSSAGTSPAKAVRKSFQACSRWTSCRGRSLGSSVGTSSSRSAHEPPAAMHCSRYSWQRSGSVAGGNAGQAFQNGRGNGKSGRPRGSRCRADS